MSLVLSSDPNLTHGLGLPLAAWDSLTRGPSSGSLPWPCLQGPAFLTCSTLVFVLPSDSCHGLHDGHHFQVYSGQITTLLRSIMGEWGIPELAVICVERGDAGHDPS